MVGGCQVQDVGGVGREGGEDVPVWAGVVVVSGGGGELY